MKKNAIIEYINQIKKLRKKEDNLIELLLSVVGSHPLKFDEDETSVIFGSPLAICDGCKHWNNSTCDIIHCGCNHEPKH